MTSVGLVFGSHILEALGHPEVLSTVLCSWEGLAGLSLVGFCCPETSWFQWVILPPLTTSLQSRESPSLSQHSPLDTCPALEPFVH